MSGRRQRQIPEHPVIKDMERFGEYPYRRRRGRILRLPSVAQNDTGATVVQK